LTAVTPVGATFLAGGVVSSSMRISPGENPTPVSLVGR
jgi:hypothetical protein